MKRGIVLLGGIVIGLAGGARAQPGSQLALNATKTVFVTSSQPDKVPEVLTYADEMPAFPGGDLAFHRYLVQKINYPAEALRRNLSGTVYVRFVVDEEGRIRDAEVAKGSGNGFDEEALRMVRMMPWWSPGRVNGKTVRVLRVLPIIFRVGHQEGLGH